MLILLGVGVGDGEEEADRLAEKVRELRIFDDAEGRMNEPLGDREVLCVSQFTLYGDARRGNRPSYTQAARPEVAEPLYDRFCERLGAKKGVFGACMGVALVNDGPVTLMVEIPPVASRQPEGEAGEGGGAGQRAVAGFAGDRIGEGEPTVAADRPEGAVGGDPARVLVMRPCRRRRAPPAGPRRVGGVELHLLSIRYEYRSRA